MPKFPVAFGRRRSTVTPEDFQNAPVTEGSSFRVLERSEVAGGKSFEGGAARSSRVPHPAPQVIAQPPMAVEDNMFADLKTNRGSGSSNTTKTASTDTSSHHSNVSTAPSSADLGSQLGPQHHDDWRTTASKKNYGELPVPPVPKVNSGGFLKNAGRTFSFGGQKKQLPQPIFEDAIPPVPAPPVPQHFSTETPARSRGMTSSTSSTATPPKIDDEDFALDLGGDFGNMFSGAGFDKRASVATLRNDGSMGPRSLTGSRANGPTPLSLDRSSKIEPPPNSWTSQRSNDNLLSSSPKYASPAHDRAPPVPRHASPLASRSHRPSDIMEDEDARLLKDSLAASSFLANPNNSQTARYRRNEDTSFSSWKEQEERKLAGSKFDPRENDDNLFDNGIALSSRVAQRYVSRAPSPPRNKVMTPAQFEKYRQDKERQDRLNETSKSPAESKDGNDDDEDNYDDDEDDKEKSQQAAKQRRKQEAHMTVYRQQMMKMTGESANPLPLRPSYQASASTPNMPTVTTQESDGSDEDEEVPLAILAAHGFPNRNRPPNRLSSIASNPNLRASVAPPPPQPARPGSSQGDAPPRPSSHLPAFARKLPQDPFLGAGLVNQPARESMHFGGGSSAPQAPVPPGGLIGVIASEERSRAMRRGSPHIEGQNFANGGAMFDPINGIPPQMMYMSGAQQQSGMSPMGQMPGMLTPGDQAQIQMTQQMQQFMQMQMQFMQMMVQQGGANPGTMPSQPMPYPMGHAPSQSMGDLTAMASRNSFVGNDQMLDLPPQLGPHMRTMSMVQPGSASWIQPAPQPQPGYAGSIRAQGMGYAPSIAPSERSNIGLPGRYRPVSHMPPPPADLRRVSTASGALSSWDDATIARAAKVAAQKGGNVGGSNSDDDDEEGWEAMKAKREKKRSLWKSKKTFGSDIGALIS